MGAPLLTTASTVMCPHGGQAILPTANARVTAGGPQVLLQSDTHIVVGCPFTVGSKYSPCVRIQWSAGATKVAVGGQPPLTQTSVGTCYGAEGAPQGVAIIASTQPRASST
jgi:hypothetical protein